MNENLTPSLIKDINPGAESSNPIRLTNVNGVLSFVTTNNNSELWKSDGTTQGTVKVPINENSALGIGSLTSLDSNLFFVAGSGTSNVSITLFKTDFTQDGTALLFGTSSGRSSSASIGNLTQFNDVVVFTSEFQGFNNITRTGVGTSELRKSDGTTSGTSVIKSFDNGGSFDIISELTKVNGTLFFTAPDTAPPNVVNGRVTNNKLWKTDGTEAGTVVVKDIKSGFESSNPDDLTNISGTLFFNADDGTNGRELWKSDGTETGTVLIEDINPGEASSNPDKLTDVNGTAYFIANNGTNGNELWKSDGTADGTSLVKDIIPGSEGSNADNLTNVNGTLFFTVDGGSNGTELWKSDGTESGTALVKDINAGTNSSNPDNLTNFDGTLYFTADNGANGTELWKSDGTADGTVLVDDINPGSTSSNPNDLTVVDGELYFSADDGVNGRELWGLTEVEGNDDNIFGVKDGNPNEFDNVPGKPNQVTIVPTQTGDIELPSKFNAKFESIVAIDGANGTGGSSAGGADFPAGSAVLRDGEEGSNDKWDFSQIELRNIAYINGRDGNDKIVGSQGADKILGGAGNDNLRGKKGDDTIEGGIGNDKILGNGGSDILNGQQGNDVLTGGGGKDKFVLSNDFGNDVITDFTLGEDEIINTTESIVLAVASVGDAINVAFSNTGDLLQVNLNGNNQAGLENYLLTLGSDRALPY